MGGADSSGRWLGWCLDFGLDSSEGKRAEEVSEGL